MKRSIPNKGLPLPVSDSKLFVIDPVLPVILTADCTLVPDRSTSESLRAHSRVGGTYVRRGTLVSAKSYSQDQVLIETHDNKTGFVPRTHLRLLPLIGQESQSVTVGHRANSNSSSKHLTGVRSIKHSSSALAFLCPKHSFEYMKIHQDCLKKDYNGPLLPVIFNYVAEFSDDISVNGADYIQLLKAEDSVWLYVRRLSDNHEGFVPKSFISLSKEDYVMLL